MISLKSFAVFAFPVVLTGALWLVAIPDADALSDATLRLAGVLLLGIAMLAIILVCRLTASSAEIPPRRVDPQAPACNEFRRGFASAASLSRKHPVRRPGVVVRLHRRRAEQRAMASKAALSSAIAPDTIETLSRRLHDRAEKLWNRRAV